MSNLIKIFVQRFYLPTVLLVLSVAAIIYLTVNRYQNFTKFIGFQLFERVEIIANEVNKELIMFNFAAENLFTEEEINEFIEEKNNDRLNSKTESFLVLNKSYCKKIILQNNSGGKILFLDDYKLNSENLTEEDLQKKFNENFVSFDKSLNARLTMVVDIVALTRSKVGNYSFGPFSDYHFLFQDARFININPGKNDFSVKNQLSDIHQLKEYNPNEINYISNEITYPGNDPKEVITVFSQINFPDEDVLLVITTDKSILYSSILNHNYALFAIFIFMSLILIYFFMKYIKVIKHKNTLLKSSEYKFRGIFESFVDLYFRTDLNGRIIMVSPSCNEIIGYKEEEVVGKSVKDFFFDEKEGDSLNPIILTVGSINDYELKIIDKSNATKIMSLNSNVIVDENEKVVGIEGTLRDITERKTTEQELLISKFDAEKAVRSKNQFFSNISHELKTPLNAIIGYAQLYKDDDALNYKTRKVFSIIENSSNYLLTLLTDLLEISKNDSGRIEIDNNTFDMHELIEGVFNIVKYKTDEKRLEFILDYDSGLPQFLRSDPKRIRQILINILGNASKFTNEGFIKLVLDYYKDELEIVVQDTGIGIPKDKTNEIFDPFFRIHSEEYEGTGLGLSITKMLVTAMGGTITVESVENQGSVFTVRIPMEISSEVQNEIELQNVAFEELKVNSSIKLGDDNAEDKTLEIPEVVVLAELKELVEARNLSAVNNLLDNLTDTSFEAFAKKIRKELNLFNIDSILEYLNRLLEEQND